MMKILFYDCGFETFGIQYLISVLKTQGYDVELMFDSSFSKDYLAQDFFLTDFLSLKPEEVAEKILAKGPDVVCFCMYTIFYRDILKSIRLLKAYRPRLTVICGGYHSTLLSSSVLENPTVDFVIRGEGEISLPSLLEEIARHGRENTKKCSPKRLPGVCNILDGVLIDRGLSPIVHNIDKIPFPEKDLYYRENPSLKILYTIIASRGCPYSCTFCNSATFNKLYQTFGERYYRCRSVKNVIAELKIAVERYRFRYVMFFDDVFGLKTSWLEEFSREYKKEIDLPYYCQTSPLIHDEKSLQLMAGSGCVQLEFGFQTANDRVRREVLNRKETKEGFQKLVKQAMDLGMFVEVDHIANLPGETEDHLCEALEFYSDLRPNWVNLSFLQFHPHTPIIQIALRKGMFGNDESKKLERGEFSWSMRMLSKSGLGVRYRILPFQIFVAHYLPKKWSKEMLRLTTNDWLCRLLSPFASFFMYLSRISLSYTDRRDFLVRHHVIRSLYAAKNVLKHKRFGIARH